MTSGSGKRSSLARYAWMSIAAAVVTISLKTGAYLSTGSVGMLSDALESLVNLIGAAVALAMLTIAARPADEEHAFGHDKAEYFSSGVEGTLILVAAAGIAAAAFPRLVDPVPLTSIGMGIGISVIASVLNLLVAIVLRRAGRRHDSITLEADATHLMTDVLTSAGVVAGIAAVALTGWNRLDPVIAILVASNIVWSGIRIIRRSVLGLMDTAIPPAERETVRSVLDLHRNGGVEFHDIRTRQSGARRFVSLHVLVPGGWTVERGHLLLECIESDIRAALPNSTVFTHLEPQGDPIPQEDDCQSGNGLPSSRGCPSVRMPGNSEESGI